MKVRIVSDTSEKNKLDIIAVTEEVGEIGFMRVSFDDTKYIIESIFVGTHFRRQNVANALLDFFLDHLPDEKTRPIEIYYAAEGDEDSLHCFMRQRDDFILIPAGQSYDIPVRAAYECDRVRSYLKSVESGEVEKHTHSLAEVPEKYLTDILARLDANSLPTYTDIEAMRADIDMDISMAYCGKSGADGAIIIRMLGENEAELSALYTAKMGNQAIELISFATSQLFERNPDMRITLLATNRISSKMAKKIGGLEAIRKEAYIGNWLMSQHFEREE